MTPTAPKEMAARFRTYDKAGEDEVRQSLKENFFQNRPPEYLSTEFGNTDMMNHVHHRFNNARNRIVPWLNAAKPVDGAKILEIGCGTGSSTVALAEQGADVYGVDIDETAIPVARKRCEVFGVSANFFAANATEVKEMFREQQFDFVLFYASLQHMLHDERLIAMRDTWDMLPAGGLWCLIDCPNRLWFYEGHTSFLPYFDWLPDDVAFLYSRYSSRPEFNNMYREYTEEARIHFLRRGRGLSFHEFSLAMKDTQDLDVVSGMSMFYREKSLLQRIKWKFSLDAKFDSCLRQIDSSIHPAFYQQSLDVIIRKD